MKLVKGQIKLQFFTQTAIVHDIIQLQLVKLASVKWKATVLEFKIQRAWRIPGMEELDVSAAITRHHLMVLALTNSKVNIFLLKN